MLGKDIKEFSSDMYKVLSDYKRNLEEDVSYVLKNGLEHEFAKLNTTLHNLRNYLKICMEMIERIPESKKIIAALKAKITPLYNCVISEKPACDCLDQANSAILALAKIFN